MNKFIFILAVPFVMGSSLFASIPASQVTDSRSFSIALEARQEIQAYLMGRVEATPELFVEVLRFLEELDSRQIGLNPKATELLELAEELGSQLPDLDEKTRDELKPIVDSLLARYPVRSKNLILLRLFDRFWLWSPDHLGFMAKQVRNDNSHLISTQLMWILERATPGQRQAFFAQIPDRKTNPSIRWFHYALALKYGLPVDSREIRHTLKLVNPERLRPAPLRIVLDGASLPNTEDLYWETGVRLDQEHPEINCSSLLALRSSR